MTAIFLLLLPVSLLLFAGVACLFLFEAAYKSSYAPAVVTVRRRLPLLAGSDLKNWAAGEARQVVTRFARRPRKAESPIALAHEVEALASEVIEQVASADSKAPANRCLQRRREPIAVTAPETLAIVDDLRRRLPKRELRKVLDLAKTNAQELAAAAVRQDAAVELPICPLLSEGGCCLTNESRPIQCRGNCSGCAPADAAVTQEQSDASFVAAVEEGVAEGLSEALAAAGWDGRRYELNSALARGLEFPDAASRWSRGEAIFARCRGI